MLARLREKAPANTEARAPVAEPAVEQPEGAPADESGEEPGDAPPEKEPSVDTEEGEDDRAGEPPIDPPRSLSKEDKEFFRSLPRERQERWAALERSRELEVRRIQNEAATTRQSAEAAQKAATEAKQQYEQRLPAVVQMLQGELSAKFPDIKTYDDVVKLAQTNPARHGEFQALAQRASAAQQEHQQAESKRQADAEAWLQTYTAEQDKRFFEAAPEYTDPKKAAQLQTDAVELLKERGFDEKEIGELWEGRKPFMLRDHRAQLLIRDAVRYRAAQKAIPSAKAQPQQPSVRPGVAPAKGAQRVAAVTELQQKLVRSGKVTDAVALLAARRAK